jgi:hypothetical protein
VVFDFLSDGLRSIVKRTYGSSPLPALRLQIAHIEQRLRSFAAFQAKSAREGWRVLHCEVAFKNEVALDVPGQDPMPLRGQIDRIDVHEREGRWRVIDYKSSESAKSPMKAHHDRKKPPDALDDLEWIDLQLPLYHFLVTRGPLKLPADRIELGYVVLPKQTGGVQWLIAEWSPEHLQHGIETAREVVRKIREGAFSELGEDIDPAFDAFARICQTTAFTSDADSESEGES